MLEFFSLITILCGLLPSFTQPGQDPGSDLDQPPPILEDGWSTASLSWAGIAPDRIAALTREIRSDRFPGIRSHLIVRHGMLVHEAYFGGTDRTTLCRIHSITKSVTSTLIGIALGDGLLGGLDATLPELLPGLTAAIIDPQAREVTLRHLLTLTAGFEWDEQSLPYGDPRNSHHRMGLSPSWIRAVLALPVSDPPGTRFVYNTGVVHLLGAILARATGRPAHEYAAEVLFEPLQIEAWDWNHDPEGHPACGGSWGGLRLQPRDLAKLGQLFLDEGRWEGRQVVPAEWVTDATRLQVETDRGGGFGFLWWVDPIELMDRRLQTFRALGFGGQVICVVPELDLVVVFTAWTNPDEAPTLGPLLQTIAAVLVLEQSQ